MRQCTINVKRLYADKYESVTAHCTQGETGFFAVWLEGDLYHMASGDDGNWWEIMTFHKHWFPEILATMKKVNEEDSV